MPGISETAREHPDGYPGEVLDTYPTSDRLPGWVTALATLAIAAGIYYGARFFNPGTARASLSYSQCGELVILDASNSRGQAFEWHEPEGVKSIPLDDLQQRRALVAPPGHHAVYVTVRSAAWGMLTESTARTEFDVDPDEPSPPGPQPPGPGPKPPEPQPDDPKGLARWAREQTPALVSSANRAAEAHDVAAVFRSCAAEISAGALSTPTEAGTRADGLIDERLGKAALAWEAWRWAMLGKARDAYGLRPSIEEVRECFLAVAAGLEGVK